MIFAVRLRAAPQRWLVAAIGLLSFTALLSAGCLPSPTVTCEDLTICSAEQACLISGGETFCATPQQIADCVDKQEGEACGEKATMNRCLNGFCQPSLCGNAVVDSEVGETCEASVPIDAPTCAQRGYDGGAVACTECTVDTNGCEHYCGDGVADPDEECDGEDVNAVLSLTCAKVVAASPKSGAVVCSRECRLDVSGCQSLLRTERIVTLPPMPPTTGLQALVPRAATVVDENEGWVIEVAGLTPNEISYFAHWTGDRWRRAKIGDDFEKAKLCDVIWATHGAAFAGCRDGHVIAFQGDAGVSGQVGIANVAIAGIWGFAANDVWAIQGQGLLHYDGATWSADSGWNALGVAATGSIISIDGDTEDLFVLTDKALFHRPRALTGSWTVAVVQPSRKFSQMSVVDKNHVWLLVEPIALVRREVHLYTGAAVTVAVLPASAVVASNAVLRAGSTTSFYIVDGIDQRQLRRFAATQFLSVFPYVEFAPVENTDLGLEFGFGTFAVGTNSVWLFGKELGVKVRGSLVETAEQIAAPIGALQHIVQGVDGTSYFTVSSRELLVKRGTAKPLERIDASEPVGVGFATIDAIAPITGPADAELLVLAANKLRVLNRGATALTPTTLDKVRGIWADGRSGFVVNGTGLFRYQGNDAAAWVSLADVHPGTVLMAGGRVNETDTVWIVTKDGANPQRLQQFTITAGVVAAEDIALPSLTTITSMWSSGPDLWIGGSASYLARWVNGRWISYDVPNIGAVLPVVLQLWSDQPGQIWALMKAGMGSPVVSLLRFDGSRWTLTDIDNSAVAPRDALRVVGNAPSTQLLALIKDTSSTYRVGQLVNPHPPLTGGNCPAQQELLCRENGHGVTAGPRTIATIVGGRFGAAHYVLNASLSGRIRFDGDLPAGVEAIWALPDASGTCVGGAPLAFAPNGLSSRAEQTLGPSRYFLTLRSRNSLDKTEYPVALDYSCNRVD